MKTRFLTLIILLTSFISTRAQELYEMMKRDINVESRSIVATAISLTPGTETGFWSLYNDMEEALDRLSDKRAANIKKFAGHYTNLTDDIANELAMTFFDIADSRNKIYKSYYKKMSKVISKKEAARFIQIMDQIQLLIDIQIAAELPLIE